MGMSSFLPRLLRSNFSDFARKSFTFELRTATKNDVEEIMEVLRKWFYPHNPLAVYSKLVSEDNRVCEEYEYDSIKPLLVKPSWSVVAINENKIIGVLLNSELNRETYPIPDIPNIKNTNFATYVDFWRHVRKETDLYGKFPDIDKVFTMELVCVDPRFRRHHVSDKLAIRALDLAKQLGYKLVMLECASAYTAEGSRKLGFQSMYSLKYEDYKINNQVVFKPTPPHERVELFVKKI